MFTRYFFLHNVERPSKITFNCLYIHSTISLIVNPLDSSSDMDAWESENGSMAEAKTEQLLPATDDPSQSISLKEDYFSSCEEETDESYSDSDSEQRDQDIPLADKQDASNTGTVKRFSGDCERIFEVLSKHDHTKNRKTYQVTNGSSPRPFDKFDTCSLNAVSEGIDINMEGRTPAEDYLSSSSSVGAVETFVNDLLEQAADRVDREDSDNNDDVVRSKKRRQRAATDTPPSSIKSAMKRDSAKRLSATSKTSSDSSNSATSNGQLLPKEETIVDSASGGSDTELDKNQFDSVDSGVVVVSGTTARTNETPPTSIRPKKEVVVVVAKETPQQISWNKAQESFETSKKNVEILRKNAARSSGQRVDTSQTAERKRHFDRLHPFHTHMLLYCSVYDTKQVLYSFQTLRNIIACDCRTFLCLSITTSMSSNSPMKQLLVR